VLLHKADSFALLTIISLYTMVVSALFSTVKCHSQPDGSQTLIDNNSIKCFEGEWKEKHLAAIVFFAIVYLILFPCWLFNIFWRTSLDFQGAPPQSRAWYLGSAQHLSFLRKTYKKRYHWWTVIELVKRLALVSIASFLTSVDEAKTVNYLATVLLLISFLLLDVAVLPYNSFETLRLALLWNSVALLVLLSDALMFKAKSVSDSAKNGVAATLIACICASTLAALLLKLPCFRGKQGNDLDQLEGTVVINNTGNVSVVMDQQSQTLVKEQCVTCSKDELNVKNLHLKLQQKNIQEDQTVSALLELEATNVQTLADAASNIKATS
jgi:hypothetical protein